jgi:hypothetical protein
METGGGDKPGGEEAEPRYHGNPRNASRNCRRFPGKRRYPQLLAMIYNAV